MNNLRRLAAFAACLSFGATPCSAGPQNRQPGTTILDANGAVVGYPFAGAKIERNINGSWYLIPFNILGFVGGTNYVARYWYTTSNCSGTKYFELANSNITTSVEPSVVAVVLDQSQPAPRASSATRTFMPPEPPPPPPPSYKSSATLYFAKPPYSILRIGSYSDAGVPTCRQPTLPIQLLLGAADSVHLSFTPPFTVK